MRVDDFKTISHLGQALWVSTEYSERVSVEALTAVSAMDLTVERSLERVSSALLQRALNDGIEQNAAAVNRTFFRLHPEERFILSALHVGRWSYERLGRIVNRSVDEIGRIAWNSRLHLISTPGRTVPVPHPTGSDTNGTRCPEYVPANPWTQRFLDEEITNRERIFLQNHVMACDRCRQALASCRNLYFAAGALIPQPDHDDDRVRIYARAFGRTRMLVRPVERGFVDSLAVFVKRRDVLLVAGGAAVFVLVNLLR